MMGTSVCKPCVRYVGNCLQSSSGDRGGAYILKGRDDAKLCKGKPRSSSITDTINPSRSKNSCELWKSWESFPNNAQKKLNPQCQSFSKSTHFIGEDSISDSVKKKSVKKMFGSKFSASFSSGFGKEYPPKGADEKYGTNRGYVECQQLEDSPSSSSSSEDLASSPYEIENDQIVLHKKNFKDATPSSSTFRQKLTKTNKINGSFVEAMDNSEHENYELWKNNEEISISTDRKNIEPNRARRRPIESIARVRNSCETVENPLINKKVNMLTGAVPKVKTVLYTNSEIKDEMLMENRPFQNQQQANLPEEEGKGLNELKNMTAEVGVKSCINHSIGRDTGDNGISFLNQISPPSRLLATENGRLKTYKNWSNKNIDPRKLAAAGFYYSGKTDIVECFRCGIKGHNWLENDKPMEDHMKWNKDCPFVRENTTERDNTQQTRQGRDYCGNFGDEISQCTETGEQQQYCRNLGVEIFPYLEGDDRTERSESPNLEKLGIRTTKGPRHPDQIIPENRLATFENWPKSLKQKPAELAAAGFYYLGIGDQTLCFYCGGGLKDWVEEDDPWEQHALWFPQCNYLLLKKTPAFVEAVQRKHNKNSSSKPDDTEEIAASCSTSNNAKESSKPAVEDTERNNPEESSTLCKICYKNELGVVFLPCGHMVACVDCASGLKECAICRKEIQANVRAFLA